MFSLSLFYRLRRANRLVIAVLFLYGLTLGVAMAAPMMAGKGISMVCTSTGIKFVNESGKIVEGKSVTTLWIAPSASPLRCHPTCLCQK